MKALTMIVVQQSSTILPEVGEVCIRQGFLPLLPLIKPLLEWEDSSHDEAKNHLPTKSSYQRVLPLLSIDHESRTCKRVGDIRIEGVIRVRDDVYLSTSHSTPPHATTTTITTTTTTSPNLNVTTSVLASVASRGKVPDRLLNSTSQYKEIVVESTVPEAKPHYKEPTALSAPENVTTTKDDQFVNSVQEGKLDNEESWKSLLVDTSTSINSFEVEEISSCTSTEDDSILLAAMSGKRQLDYKRSKINHKYLRKRPRLDDSSLCSINNESDLELSPATLDYTRGSNIESIGDVSFPLLIDRVCREKVRKIINQGN
jgi:hypothetical protein